MADWVFRAIMALPVAYIICYIWTLVFRIIPWLDIGMLEIYKLTLLQMVATMIFFTFGTFLFIVCVIFLIGMALG